MNDKAKLTMEYTASYQNEPGKQFVARFNSGNSVGLRWSHFCLEDQAQFNCTSASQTMMDDEDLTRTCGH